MSTLYRNGVVVTMDDAGSEHDGGWLLVDGTTIAAVGGGPEPEADERVDLKGAVVTPGLVNTHNHLYQTLTRTRAQEADLFTWLRTLYPVWSRIDAESEYAAARTGLAELALSGCTTVFDHHYVFPKGREGLIEAEVQAAREIGLRIVASRGSMDLGVSDGGLPPDELVEDLDAVLAETERLASLLHEPGPGARVQLAVAPCSPFSVTGRLMEESASLARRLGLPLHTHLAETLEEEAYCNELSAGWQTMSGAPTASISPSATSRSSRPPAPVWRTAPPPTCGSVRASRRCVTCSTRAYGSASASTARRRTSAATSSSRSSSRCSSRAAGTVARR